MKKDLSLIIILILVLFFGVYYFNNKSNQSLTDNSVKTTDNTQTFTLQVISSDNSISIYQIPFEPGQKLANILSTFSQNNSNFTIETQKSDYGDYLLSINGVKADTSIEFWNVKINGVDSTVGISDMEPQNNDIITFSLLKFQK